MENGGIATRDFIYVEDMARGLHGLRRCAATPASIYNLASGVETSIRELAETINELTGNPTPIALAPARDWDHSGQRFGDPGKAERELGFRAEVGLRDGLERTIEWTRANLDWIESCMARHADRMAELEVSRGMKAARHRRAGGDRHRAVRRAPRGRTGARSGRIASCFTVLARRDVSVRYKQSFIGALWSLVQPLSFAAVFSIFFGPADQRRHRHRRPLSRLRGPRHGDVAVLHGGRSAQISESTVSSAPLISKVYFPRLVIPLAVGHGTDRRLRRRHGGGLRGHPRVRCHPTRAGHPGAAARPARARRRALALECGSPRSTSSTGTSATSCAFIILLGLFISPIVYPFSTVPAQYHVAVRAQPHGGRPGADAVDGLARGGLPDAARVGSAR